MDDVEYEIELTGTFVKEIHSRVLGPTGLGRDQIENLIEADWAIIAADKSVLLESSWRLESFEPLPTSQPAPKRDGDHGNDASTGATLTPVEHRSVTAWALLVTQGTIHAYPPELYLDRGRSAQEAERWAWILGGAGVAEVGRPFEGRWEVAGFDVRLVRVKVDPDLNQVWVGTYWSQDGTPDPEAVVFSSREEALSWAVEPVEDLAPAFVDQSEWFVAATFLPRGEEAYAVAHRAKIVR